MPGGRRDAPRASAATIEQPREPRNAENLAAAEARLQQAVASYDALPIPGRVVSDEEVSAARNAAAAIRVELDGIEREILRAYGALEQLEGRLPASGCGMQPRLSMWRRARKGKSRKNTRPGSSCSNR